MSIKPLTAREAAPRVSAGNLSASQVSCASGACLYEQHARSLFSLLREMGMSIARGRNPTMRTCAYITPGILSGLGRRGIYGFLLVFAISASTCFAETVGP